MTVREFLERWLAHIRPQVSPRTHERYSELVRAYLVPALGNGLLSKLSPINIGTAYSAALSSGRRRDGSGLSPRSVHHIHRVLKQALKQAARWQLIARNPADHVDPPRVERREMKVWDVGTMAAALDKARPLRVFVPALLAGLCALRRGEIVALRWRHVDLDRGQLTIMESAEQTRAGVRLKAPKSGRGRTVALPAKVTAELRGWGSDRQRSC
jgi:integrase